MPKPIPNQIAKALIVVDTTNISRNGIKRSRILITPSYLCQVAGNNCQNATISMSETETKKHVPGSPVQGSLSDLGGKNEYRNSSKPKSVFLAQEIKITGLER